MADATGHNLMEEAVPQRIGRRWPSAARFSRRYQDGPAREIASEAIWWAEEPDDG